VKYAQIAILLVIFLLAGIFSSDLNFPMYANAQDESLVQFEPDIFFQFSICLPANLAELVIEQTRDLITRIKVNPDNPDSPPAYPNPYIAHTCVAGKENLAIWVRSTDDASITQKRDEAIKNKNVVQQGPNNFYMNIWAPFIDRESKWRFDTLTKNAEFMRNYPNLYPDHFVVRYTSPTSPQKVVETVVFGRYDIPGPDVEFQYVIADSMALADGKMKCKSDKWLSRDVSALRATLYLFTPVIFYPSFVPYFESYVNTEATPPFDVGAGCAFASIAPNEIMIPGPLDIGPLHFKAPKIVFNHEKLDLSLGFTTQGTIIPKERDPKVLIVGPNVLQLPDGNSASLTYEVKTEDMRSDADHPLLITWSSEGSHINNPTASVTQITFPTGDIEPGGSVWKRINVNVTDADNLNAVNHLDLFLFRDASCPAGYEWDPVFGECVPREPRCRPGWHYDWDLRQCVPDQPVLEDPTLDKPMFPSNTTVPVG
jgi:hypothetical protein